MDVVGSMHGGLRVKKMCAVDPANALDQRILIRSRQSTPQINGSAGIALGQVGLDNVLPWPTLKG